MSKQLLFDKSIKKLDVLFRYSGINLRNKILKTEDILKYRWLLILNCLWSCSALIIIMVGIAKGMDLIELMSVAPCLIFTVLGMSKSIFHFIHEHDVQELIRLLRDLETKDNNRKQRAEREDIIYEETDFLNKVINVLYALNCSLVIVFDVTPLVLIAVKYYRTNEFEMMLPYQDVFAFIPNKLKYWPFAYVHQIWSECIVLLEISAADYLFFTCCTYIRVQFRLLQYDIERTIPFDEDEHTEEVKDRFVELIQWHQDIIKSSDILEAIYSKSTLFNFLSSSLVICFTGFVVTIVNDIEMIITFVTFLCMGLMQVYFLCFFADMLMSASVEVSDAIYKSRWYSASPVFNKQLFLVQIRSQKPCKLTAAGFTDVNLRAFMRVLSTAWSYFALLQTMYSR